MKKMNRAHLDHILKLKLCKYKISEDQLKELKLTINSKEEQSAYTMRNYILIGIDKAIHIKCIIFITIEKRENKYNVDVKHSYYTDTDYVVRMIV